MSRLPSPFASASHKTTRRLHPYTRQRSGLVADEKQPRNRARGHSPDTASSPPPLSPVTLPPMESTSFASVLGSRRITETRFIPPSFRDEQDDDGANAVHEEEFHPVPLFDLEKLGPKDQDRDNFSFLDGRHDTDTAAPSDEVLTKLYGLVDLYGQSGDLKTFASRIQRFYDDEFRPYQDGQPEWTLQSILKFVEEKGGMTPRLMRQGILQMLWQCLLLLRDGGIKVQNKRGKSRLDPVGFDQMSKLVRVMLPLIKAVER